MTTVQGWECLHTLTCELEDWFHILDSKSVPPIEEWPTLSLRAERNIEKLLALFDDTSVRATFFCLGWMAERMPHVVRQCQEAGHEIGSHGYAHIMAHKVGRASFREDIVRSRKILEDITGKEVLGFRSPGFSVRNDNPWFFDVVRGAGYKYDASVFPAHHGHGGFRTSVLGPHIIKTANGPLVEVPVSTVKILGQRVCLFGGGHLRITPLPLLRWGLRRLHEAGQPLVVYVHPREVDPGHPRLSLGPWRRFKCYANVRTTMPKLKWLCEHYPFTTMADLAETVEDEYGWMPPTRPSADETRRLPMTAMQTRRSHAQPVESPTSR